MPRDPTLTLNPPAGETSLAGADLAPGALAGSWRIVELHARGGYGSVYRARHTSDGRQAAVKLLHRFLHPSRAARDRFEREIAVVGRIVHPNVVPLYEAGVLDDGRQFCAMEWIDGPSLDRVIGRAPFALDEAVRVMDGVCAGVDAAHAAGVLHRDLKAANVLLGPGEAPASVRLVDFGIALLFHDDEVAAQLTASGIRIGTPSSMAPEQIAGEALGPTTDVYALGVLLYQILTGRLPFEAQTAVEVEAMHLGETPPLASQHARVPGAIDDVISRCLEKVPARRYASASSLAAALHEAALAGSSAKRVAAGRRVAAAIHVHGAPGLSEARHAALAAGYQIVREWPDALFVATVLSDDAEEQQREQERAGAWARSLARAQPEGRVRMHVAPVKTLVVAGATRIVGGELLALASWPDESLVTPGT